MYAVQDLPTVPTKLRRISAALEPAVYEALAAYSARSKRSVSNQIAVIIEQVLLTTGDLSAPIPKPETRGGARKGAGRKPKADEEETED